jgi:hypothetical protein
VDHAEGEALLGREHGGGGVGRADDDDDDFERLGEVLSGERVEQAAEARRAIAGGDDDGDGEGTLRGVRPR